MEAIQEEYQDLVLILMQEVVQLEEWEAPNIKEVHMEEEKTMDIIQDQEQPQGLLLTLMPEVVQVAEWVVLEEAYMEVDNTQDLIQEEDQQLK